MTRRGRWWWTVLAAGVAAMLAGCIAPPDVEPPPQATISIVCGPTTEPTQVFVGETALVTRAAGRCDGFRLRPTQLFSLRSGYFRSTIGAGAYAEVAEDGSFSFELAIPAEMRLGWAVLEAVPVPNSCDPDEALGCLPPSALVTVSHRPSALRTVNVVSSGLRPPPLPAEWGDQPYVLPGPARNQLTVVLFGSSCESVPAAFVATAPRDSLQLVSRQPTGEACRELAIPWTSIIEIPARYAGFSSVRVDNVPAELLPPPE